jgi:hypothetical protein
MAENVIYISLIEIMLVCLMYIWQAWARLPFESKRMRWNGTITKISGVRLFYKILLPTVNGRQMTTGYIGH